MQRMIEKDSVPENPTLFDFQVYLSAETGTAVVVEEGSPILESQCKRFWIIDVWSTDGMRLPPRRIMPADPLPIDNPLPPMPILGDDEPERLEFESTPEDILGWTPGIATGKGFNKR